MYNIELNARIKLQNSTPPDPWLLADWRRTKIVCRSFFSSNLHFVLLSCQNTTRKRTSRKENFYGRLCWFWKHLGMDIRLLLHETKKCPEGFVLNFFSICWPRQCNLTIWQNQEQDHSNVRTDTPLIQKDKHFPAKIFSVCCNTIAQQLIISAISEHALVSHEMVASQWMLKMFSQSTQSLLNRFFPAVVFLVLFIALRCAES